MQIGSALGLLLVVLIGSGYLLSDNVNMHQDLMDAQQKINEITREKNAIQGNLDNVIVEVTGLRHQNDLLDQKNLLIEEHVKQLQQEYEVVKDQNAQLRAQITTMNRFKTLINALTNLNPRSLILALFVPLLPISLASSLLIYLKGRIHNRSSLRRVVKSNRILSMQVTDEEMKLIRQLRRNMLRTSS